MDTIATGLGRPASGPRLDTGVRAVATPAVKPRHNATTAHVFARFRILLPPETIYTLNRVGSIHLA